MSGMSSIVELELLAEEIQKNCEVIKDGKVRCTRISRGYVPV